MEEKLSNPQEIPSDIGKVSSTANSNPTGINAFTNILKNEYYNFLLNKIFTFHLTHKKVKKKAKTKR